MGRIQIQLYSGPQRNCNEGMRGRFFVRQFILLLFLIGIFVLYVGCPGKLSPITPPTDNTTASEVAEAIVSGTVNATYSGGSQGSLWPREKKTPSLVSEILKSFLLEQPAYGQRLSAGICPSVQAGGPTCTVSANSMTLPLPVCNYTGQGPYVTWSGNETITNGGPTLVNCATFPPFNNGDVLVRTFSTPTARMTPNWVIVLIDTSNAVAGFSPPVAASGVTISYSGPVDRD